MASSDNRERIIQQIEFYFSDSNFPKDKFLRTTATMHPDGCKKEFEEEKKKKLHFIHFDIFPFLNSNIPYYFKRCRAEHYQGFFEDEGTRCHSRVHRRGIRSCEFQNRLLGFDQNHD